MDTHEAIPDQAAAKDDALPRTVELPPMLPDQVEYLRRMQVAVSDYDPETMIHGRKPPTDITP